MIGIQSAILGREVSGIKNVQNFELKRSIHKVRKGNRALLVQKSYLEFLQKIQYSHTDSPGVKPKSKFAWILQHILVLFIIIVFGC